MGVWQRIEIVQGDITKLDVDAIVNAANASLSGGGGVDGAIHKAAGRQLGEYCRTLGGCPPGEAKITPGFSLAARYIIHTVGPVYSGADDDARLLGACYRNSLFLAKENQVKSIAFPAISCGVYGYPIEAAAGVALDSIRLFLAENSLPDKVFVVLFSAEDLEVYRELVARLQSRGDKR